MKIKYIGHSTFLLTSDNGIRILTDPYKPGAYGGGLTYGPITDSADIVVLSHEHEDHADIESLPNSPLVVRTDALARGIAFDVVETYHDDAGGEKRGKNRVTCFELDGIRVCHLGDLGHVLSPEQVEEIGQVDILLLPVGGTFTIGPVEAAEVMRLISPSIVIPMHFKSEKCGFPIEPVETFLKEKEQIRRSSSSEVVINKEDIVDKCSVLYLPPSN